MNIDRNKLLKMLAILAAICVIVGSVAKLAGGNSMTLTEYVEKNRTAESGSAETGKPETLPSSKPLEASSAAPTETVTSTESTENLQNDIKEKPISTLIGASLNGDSKEDLRFTYADAFYYEPLSDNLQRYITGVSYPALAKDAENSTDLAVSYEDLRYLHILHYDFDGNPAEGELICNEAIAQDLVEIFYELYRNEYQLERVLLIDEYDGDDTASMEDNNTSCFNYRVVEGSASLSKHALGLAVDLNPFYNPYITYEKDGSQKVSPAAAVDYADRTVNFPYKIDENDLCYKLFQEHGFIWGGNWNSCKDYQHFQKTPD